MPSRPAAARIAPLSPVGDGHPLPVETSTLGDSRRGQFYLRVKDSSMVMMTGTGWPCRMPGEKRQLRAALMAS